MGYDPKRPRPSVATESQVDALIEPVTPVVEPLAAVPEVPEPAADAPVTDAVTVEDAPPSPEAPAPSSDRPPTPVVPAPAEGTANRAVLAAVAVAVAAFVAVVVLLRRRRQG
jgi:hypothetical protein